jgi:Response regulator receiver domain
MAKILVAEDEKQIGDMIAFKLSNSGHQVVRAPDGEQALTLASRELPDLILLDAMMPGGERLRSSPAPQGGFLVASDPGDHGDGKRTRAGRVERPSGWCRRLHRQAFQFEGALRSSRAGASARASCHIALRLL